MSSTQRPPSMSRCSTRFRIRSACSRPREGCAATSTQTCSTSHGSHAFRPNHATKHRLRCRRLPDDEIRWLARSAGSQVLPGGQVRRLDAVDVDVGRHAADEPEPQRVCSSEQGEAGSAAAKHPAELGLLVARQEEAHRHFPRRARRKGLPAAEQVLASHEAQVGGRLVQVALALELLDESERTHHRHVRRTRQLRRVAVLPSRGETSNSSGSSGASSTFSIHWLRSEKNWPESGADLRIDAGRCLARRVHLLEVRARGTGASPRNRSHRRPRPERSARANCHHLLSGARRDAGRRDDGEGHRLLTGGVRRLEHRLREEGHEPITRDLLGLT